MTRLWNRLPKNVKSMTLDDFKLYLKQEVKPKRRKFYAKGNKYKCSLLTRIRVVLETNMWTRGLSQPIR